TPNGVVRAVMNAFTVLHRELDQLLRDDTNSTVLNADVLIPSLVLMMSRLNHDSELDLLWRRLNLVRVFHATLLSQGCEEAYYVTCLQAAMHVIQTFAATDASAATGATRHISLVDTRRSCDHCQELIVHQRRYRVTVKRSCNNSNNNEDSRSTSSSTRASDSNRAETTSLETRRKPSPQADTTTLCAASCPPQLSEDAAAIENLSNWIAGQASVDHLSTPDNTVPAHELWLYEHAE
ncbi:Vacuolar sorting protein 9, partial [Globisporangium polare]